MKKLLALLLAGVLCFSLSACGNNKYDPLIELLDKGDYDGAMDYIKDLQGSGELIGVLGTAGTEPEATEPSPETAAMLKALPGKWVCTTEKETLTEFVFREDGTCTVDSEALTWSVSPGHTISSSTNKEILRLTVQEGQTKRYNLTFYEEKSGEVSFTCGIYKDNVVSTGYGDRYVRLDAYETVELTLDNWQKYFEWTEFFFHDTDAFGDISRRSKFFYLTLKQEYYPLLSQYHASKGAVEISYQNNNYSVTLNGDGLTFEKGSFADVAGYGSSYTGQYTLERGTFSNTSFFGAYYTWHDVWEPEQYQEIPKGYYCEYAEHQKVTRIQGTLYFVK